MQKLFKSLDPKTRSRIFFIGFVITFFAAPSFYRWIQRQFQSKQLKSDDRKNNQNNINQDFNSQLLIENKEEEQNKSNKSNCSRESLQQEEFKQQIEIQGEKIQRQNSNQSLKFQDGTVQVNQHQDQSADEIKNFDQNQQTKQAYQILNEKFYLPSFKSRQIQDEILKKFVRGFQSVVQYQEEYNLDKSQEQLLSQHIHYFISIRGDGNCLFTSIGIQYVYFNIIDAERYKILKQKIIDLVEFKQNFNDQVVESLDQQKLLKDEFIVQLNSLRGYLNNEKLLEKIADHLNKDEGPFYGLLIIFMRNYFRKLLQDFYDNNEMNFLIQNPEKINEILTWEYMYDETDIALKLFATEEKILIRCYQKMNVDDKIVQISEYKADEQVQFQYKIGLAFQPGHYNAILLKD